MDNREILKKKLSIGHNGSPKFKNIMKKYKDYIHEVYFSPPEWVIQSTRPNPMTHDSNYTKIIKEDIEFSEKENLNIKFSLVLNSQCWNGEFRSNQLVQRIIDYMEMLEYKFDNVVVSDQFLAKVLKPLMPDKTFTTSVIMGLNDVNSCIELLRQFPDFDMICVGHKLTYNREEIELIKRVTGKKIKLLINQGCYFNCPDYILHSTALAHSVKYVPPMESGKKFHCDFVNSKLDESSWRSLTHQALSPENLYYYKDCVDSFKLSTRIETNIDRIDAIIKGYIMGDKRVFAKKLFMGGGRSVAYDIAAIFSLVEYPKDYIEVRNRCNNRCLSCNYCKNLWEKAVEKYKSLPNDKKPTRKELYFRDDILKKPM